MRLIDADKLKNYIRTNFSKSMRQQSVLTSIDEQPVVDVNEIRHGEWRETEEPLGWEDVSTAECSVCGDSHILDDWTLDEFKRFYLYCPACGAKMDGGQKDAID